MFVSLSAGLFFMVLLVEEAVRQLRDNEAVLVQLESLRGGGVSDKEDGRKGASGCSCLC